MLRIVLCGCTKNSTHYLWATMERLYSMRHYVTQFEMVVYENDSSDNTPALLEAFRQSHEGFDYISETGVDDRLQERTDRLARGRNQLLNFIREKEFDYMIMVDFDAVANLEMEHVHRIMTHYPSDRWDALTANCTGRYYDIWALRVPSFLWLPYLHGRLWHDPIDYDCWTLPHAKAKRNIASLQVVIPPDAPLIPVQSAFGGFGIYKKSSIHDCFYASRADDRSIVCEHVAFHSQMLDRHEARIFICPPLLVDCQTEHLQPLDRWKMLNFS